MEPIESFTSGKLHAVTVNLNGSKLVIYDGVEVSPSEIELTPLEQLEVDSAVYIPPAVPLKITMAQARLALLTAGLLELVDAQVSSLPAVAAINWQYRQNVERDSPLVASLAAALNLDAAAVDNLFILGASL